MDRVFSSGVSATTPVPPAAPAVGYPKSGTPGGDIATKPGAYWFYMITEELRGVIEAGGIAPDHEDVTQLTQAISAMIEAAVGGVHQPGEVAFFAQNVAPTGYLKANGAPVSRAIYAALFTAIGTTYGSGDGVTTFNLPDLRGEFVRGWDDSRGVDSGREIGSAQGDTLQGHHHRVSYQAVSGGSYPQWSGGISSYADGDVETAMIAGDAVSDGVNGTPRIGPDTRPRNIALLACIKF